ncbi:hypothetical protein Tco_0806272, partial [Tanacetum coccineum]
MEQELKKRNGRNEMGICRERKKDGRE